MSNPDKDQFDMSDLSSNLPAAAAALSAEDRDNLVNALKDKLHTLAGKHSDVMETLSPKIKKRVKVLQELQGQYDELEAEFFKERAALEAKYDGLYEPIYSKRYEIVNAVVEVDGVTKSSKDVEGVKEGEDEKGVPYFWLNALKNNEIVGEEIWARDEDALKYLKDIKCTRIANPRGFKLEFFFDTNPFFKNSVLTKTYNMADDNEPIMERAIGTHIEWHPGKCLTTKVLKKKPKKGSKNVKPITKVEKCESLFNFFNPPQLPEDGDELDIDNAEELESLLERDYDVGSTIRDKIVPHAVSWFTGEAVEGDDLDDIVYGRDDDDNDNDDHEEEDDDKEGEGKKHEKEA